MQLLILDVELKVDMLSVLGRIAAAISATAISPPTIVEPGVKKRMECAIECSRSLVT